jgi:hypothetical protein
VTVQKRAIFAGRDGEERRRSEPHLALESGKQAMYPVHEYVQEKRMPETVSDTRRRLTQHVQQFRDQGVEAAPVIFGDRRQPEAALLPYETLSMLLDIAEDIAIAQRIRERDAADTGDRTTLADAADELGVDLDEL